MSVGAAPLEGPPHTVSNGNRAVKWGWCVFRSTTAFDHRPLPHPLPPALSGGIWVLVGSIGAHNPFSTPPGWVAQGGGGRGPSPAHARTRARETTHARVRDDAGSLPRGRGVAGELETARSRSRSLFHVEHALRSRRDETLLATPHLIHSKTKQTQVFEVRIGKTKLHVR